MKIVITYINLSTAINYNFLELIISTFLLLFHHVTRFLKALRPDTVKCLLSSLFSKKAVINVLPLDFVFNMLVRLIRNLKHKRTAQ